MDELPSRAPPTIPDTKLSIPSQILDGGIIHDTIMEVKSNFSADSHAMAQTDYGAVGAVQTQPKTTHAGVRDIGWHRPASKIPDPLIGELPNEKLFAMMRRFNKDVFDVQALPSNASRGLDLNDAWSDKHSSDKMILNLERGYLSIFLSLANAGKQLARLRSWNDPRRTGIFCAVYFAAWLLDLLLPLLLGTLIVAVSSQQARDMLFPPIPLSLVNISTGEIQDPQAGKLGTTGTLTGAQEKVFGEAVDEEASNFVQNLRHLFQQGIGMQQGQDANKFESKIPDSIKNAGKAIKSAGVAPETTSKGYRQTHEPMEQIIWDKVNPEQIELFSKAAPHVLGEIVDTWERLQNTISPTAPFNRRSFLRIDGILVPLFLASFFINYYIVYKIVWFSLGVVLFGKPGLSLGLRWLNNSYPQWRENLDPKNNILRGAPTNSQLTLTLLRIGEAYKNPIPSGPASSPFDSNLTLPSGTAPTEITNASEPPESEHDDSEAEEPKHKRLSKFMRFVKGNARKGTEAQMVLDRARLKTNFGYKKGIEKAKGEVGILPTKKNIVFAGPSEYKCHHDGQSGWVSITDRSLLFKVDDEAAKVDPIVDIRFTDMRRLARVPATPGKVIKKTAAWAHEKEMLGSIEIEDVSGQTRIFTAMAERDELFNRLVAVGLQKWEIL